MNRPTYTSVLVLTCFFLFRAGPAWAGGSVQLGSSFNFQAQLAQDGVPVNTDCDFRFGLWETESGPFGLLATTELLAVSVQNGLFNVELDYGFAIFDGNERWLEVEVACPAGDDPPVFTTLVPRQRLAPIPYALQTRGIRFNSSNNVGIGLQGTSQFLTVRPFDRELGVNTQDPFAKLHVVDVPRNGTEDAIREDVFVVEDSDAIIGLYSGRSGTSGSMIAMKEIADGAMTDNWTIWRGTSNSDSSLHVSFGTEPAGTLNPDALTLAPDGNVGAGTQTPATRMHLVGDSGLRVDGSDGTPLFRAGNGSVRIGTANSTAQLAVQGQPETQTVRFTGPEGNFRFLQDLNSAGQAGWRFRNNATGAPAVEFTAGGLVGIGGVIPQAKLDVDGDVLFRGEIRTATRNRSRVFAPTRCNLTGPAFINSVGSRAFVDFGSVAGFSNAFLPLELPDGASVSALSAFVEDSNDGADKNIVMRLFRQGFGGSPAFLAEAETSGTPGQTLLEFAVDFTVDRSNFDYYLRFTALGFGGNDGLRLFEVDASYTIDTIN